MIYIGADHGGFELKKVVVEHLLAEGFAVQDCGTQDDNRVDYPDFAQRVCQLVTQGEGQDFGILVCGTGIGMSMSANRQRGIRAAVCSDTYCARMARRHNDANVLCMGQRVLGAGLALDIVDSFLSAEFEGGRHALRVAKIDRDRQDIGE